VKTCPDLSAVAWKPRFRLELCRGEGGRDSMKEAQYEVLGNDAKRHVRPARDDRNIRLLVSRTARRLSAPVDCPVQDGYVFKNANPALRTGLLSPGPCGTDFLKLPNDLCNPDCDLLRFDACGQPSDRYRRIPYPATASSSLTTVSNGTVVRPWRSAKYSGLLKQSQTSPVVSS